MSFDPAQPAYRSLRNIIAEETSGVVAWVGSGCSAEAGLPTWPALKTSLLDSLLDKCNSLEAHDRERLYKQYLSIRDEPDYWLAFQRLRDSLGQATFRQVIREALQLAVNVPIPQTYSSLWQLRIKGLISLNLDRLATRAYQEQDFGAPPTEFSGRNVGSYFHVLRSPHPFILNLHGNHEDAATWILTRDDLLDIGNTASFKKFTQTCLLSYTVVFIGMSVDDVAVRTHLSNAKSNDIDWGAHYWITERSDLETDSWAESLGIRVIRYPAQRDHSALSELFQDLLEYTATDEDAEPVVPSAAMQPTTYPDPHILAQQSAEEIRQTLNALAKEVLAPGNQESYEQFDSFCDRYDEAIYRAWYTSSKEGANQLLGFTLLEEVATGAFGQVYQAKEANGNIVAVKVLKESIRRNRESLQSFRRGVRSMRILENHKLEGMVEFREASEIPTFVVMKFINGPTLREAVDARQFKKWDEILLVAVGLTQVIHRAHRLPERVLHRDLRPSNIMLKGYWTDPRNWTLVVLDFDLSWHRGAYEVSVIHGQTSVGYMAPEQIRRMEGVSTRHASVDSFGLGMTLFFLLSGRDPVSQEHQHRDWQHTLAEAARSYDSPRWKSLPARFARLIENGTRHEQATRWDVGQIEAELVRLRDAVLDPSSVSSAELVAEEVAARTTFGEVYQWHEDAFAAECALGSGLSVIIRGNETMRAVQLEVKWISSGTEDRKRVGKWLPDKAAQARALLERRGWKIEDSNLGVRNFFLRCQRQAAECAADLHGAKDDIDEVASLLSFV